MPAFQSVILAGVYDIRSLKRKLHPDEPYRENSPWNIAAAFRVDLSLSAAEIAGMLEEYEGEHGTGMDRMQMSGLLYDYTSGYPYLVSWICKCMDEELVGQEGFPDHSAAWTEQGFLAAVKRLLEDSNPLFESIMQKLNDFPELNAIILRLLFQGMDTAYNADDIAIQNARMFGFVKICNSTVHIANRIFEMRLYNKYLSDCQKQNYRIYTEGIRQKNQFFTGGYLDVRRVLEKFVETFHYLYGEKDMAFLEDEGRRYFMLFLKPIINGVGNCSVEPRTRNNERMDLVIDYLGEQFVIELKLWRGKKYHHDGQVQLAGYLEQYHQDRGYLLTFNFNKHKQIGVTESVCDGKQILEVIV